MWDQQSQIRQKHLPSVVPSGIHTEMENRPSLIRTNSAITLNALETKEKSVELIISMLSHGIIDHYHFPVVLVKVDRNKWPNLIFKKSRVTVQGEGKIFVLLKNKSSDIILT